MPDEVRPWSLHSSRGQRGPIERVEVIVAMGIQPQDQSRRRDVMSPWANTCPDRLLNRERFARQRVGTILCQQRQHPTTSPAGSRATVEIATV
jgi:hypothetical protein